MEISPPSRSMTWRISAKKRFRFSSSNATWSEYVHNSYTYSAAVNVRTR